MVNSGFIEPARRFLTERRLKSLKAVCLTTNLCVFIFIFILIILLYDITFDIRFVILTNNLEII